MTVTILEQLVQARRLLEATYESWQATGGWPCPGCRGTDDHEKGCRLVDWLTNACHPEPHISRVCEVGTHGCNTRHGPVTVVVTDGVGTIGWGDKREKS